MDTIIIKTIELKERGNMIFGLERGGPCLDGKLRSTVIGNGEGKEKKPLFIKEGAVNNVYAAIPVMVNDIMVFVECDTSYNINISLTRITSISKSDDGKIIATCKMFDLFKDEKWLYNEHKCRA